MDYAGLLAEVNAYSEQTFTAGTASGSTLFDQFVDNSELKIYSDINLPFLTTVSSVASTSGTFAVPKPTSPVCFVVRTVRPLTTTGYGTYLQQKPTSYLREFWPTSAVSTPLYWSDFNDINIQVAPTPDSSTTAFEYLYTYRPAQLSYSNTTTWVSVNAPRVLLYATLCEVATYLKQVGDPQGMAGMAARYEGLYKEALGALQHQLLQDGGDSFNAGQFT